MDLTPLPAPTTGVLTWECYAPPPPAESSPGAPLYVTVADHTGVAIEQAISAAIAMSIGAIYIPRGVYLIDRPILVTASQVPLRLFGDWPVLRATSAMHAMLGVVESCYVTVERLVLDGAELARTCVLARGIRGPGCLLREVMAVRSRGPGFVVEHCDGGLLTDCLAQECLGDGFRVVGCRGTQLYSCRSTLNRGAGFRVLSSVGPDSSMPTEGSSSFLTFPIADGNGCEGIAFGDYQGSACDPVELSNFSAFDGWADANGGDGVSIESSGASVHGMRIRGSASLGTQASAAVRVGPQAKATLLSGNVLIAGTSARPGFATIDREATFSETEQSSPTGDPTWSYPMTGTSSDFAVPQASRSDVDSQRGNTNIEGTFNPTSGGALGGAPIEPRKLSGVLDATNIAAGLFVSADASKFASLAAALQSAVESGATTFHVPNGRWDLAKGLLITGADTGDVPGFDVVRVRAPLRIVADWACLLPAQDQELECMLRIQDVHTPLVIERLAMYGAKTVAGTPDAGSAKVGLELIDAKAAIIDQVVTSSFTEVGMKVSGSCGCAFRTVTSAFCGQAGWEISGSDACVLDACNAEHQEGGPASGAHGLVLRSSGERSGTCSLRRYFGEWNTGVGIALGTPDGRVHGVTFRDAYFESVRRDWVRIDGFAVGVYNAFFGGTPWLADPKMPDPTMRIVHLSKESRGVTVEACRFQLNEGTSYSQVHVDGPESNVHNIVANVRQFDGAPVSPEYGSV